MVIAFRTAEVLLEICRLDLILDNTIDCQSKLVLVSHLMGVAPPVVPEVAAVGGKKQAEPSPGLPVQIGSRNNRTGFVAKKVPEIPIHLQQDATHRSLLLPFNHQGASPTVKTRKMTDGIFPTHSLDCYCLTCTSELVATVRCTALNVQAKLWSVKGFEDVAKEEFLSGCQLVEFICSRLRNPIRATNTLSKRLFNVPEALKISEMWAEHRVQWFQTSFTACMELLWEYSMYMSSLEAKNPLIDERLQQLKRIMDEFFVGPLDCQAIKLVTAVNIAHLQLNSAPQILNQLVQEQNFSSPIIAIALKTPALEPRTTPTVPPPRRVRRNLFAFKIDDTITVMFCFF